MEIVVNENWLLGRKYLRKYLTVDLIPYLIVSKLLGKGVDKKLLGIKKGNQNCLFQTIHDPIWKSSMYIYLYILPLGSDL